MQTFVFCRLMLPPIRMSPKQQTCRKVIIDIISCVIASIQALLIGLSVSILCMTPSIVLWTNMSQMIALFMFIIANLDCRSLDFMVIMLKRKQLRMTNPNAAKMLPCPRELQEIFCSRPNSTGKGLIYYNKKIQNIIHM